MQFSLVQVNNILQTIATDHKQIESYGFGDPFMHNEKHSVAYPCMFFTLQDGTTVEGNQIRLRGSLLFMDRVKSDMSNLASVLSDTLQVAMDVRAQLKSPAYEENFLLDNNSSLTDFIADFDDDVSGWKLDLTILIDELSDRCAVPSDLVATGDTLNVTIYESDGVTVYSIISPGGSFILPTGSCDPVTILDQNNNTIDTIASGGTYNVLLFSSIGGGNASTIYTDQVTGGNA